MLNAKVILYLEMNIMTNRKNLKITLVLGVSGLFLLLRF